jgi:CCR4-NOT transcription complex subunit 3
MFEGIETFEHILIKLENSVTANQREKNEVDLKKELKKLQRHRDQLKAWYNNPDVKCKEFITQLINKIELQMSRHKIVENESRKSWKHKNKSEKQEDECIDEQYEWISEFLALFKEKLSK